MMQIKKNIIIIRHSFVPSTISNDSNTQYSQSIFNLISRKKITESKCLIIDEEQDSKPAFKDFLKHLSFISGKRFNYRTLLLIMS